MSPLKSFREGWRSEALAYYIISKFAFLDNPSSIGDDVGVDFICNIFDEEKKGNKTFILPSKFSFAIQIKSNSIQFKLKPYQIKYLSNMQNPYFVGVINNKNKSLTIYSNDAFDFYISKKDFKTPLWLRLSQKKIPFKDRCIRENKRTILILNKVITLNTDFNFENELNDLKSMIQIMQYNIYSRFNSKFVFLDPYDPQEDHKIVLGKDSFNRIQIELFNYLQIYTKNIEWLKETIKNCKSEKHIDNINKMLEFSESAIKHFNDNVPKYFCSKVTNETLKISKMNDLKELISQIHSTTKK